jgi:hypothetical protein
MPGHAKTCKGCIESRPARKPVPLTICLLYTATVSGASDWQLRGDTRADSHVHLSTNRSCHRYGREYRCSNSRLSSGRDDASAMPPLWNATPVSNRTWTPLTAALLAVQADLSVGCLGYVIVFWKNHSRLFEGAAVFLP